MMHSPANQDADDSSDDAQLRIDIRLANGRVESIPAAVGFTAMELIRAAGLPIIAECGGAAVCATCHCRVGGDWVAVLPPPSDEEVHKLDDIPTADNRSRLSCQIQMTEALDGLVLELQPDSVKTGAFTTQRLDRAA